MVDRINLSQLDGKNKIFIKNLVKTAPGMLLLLSTVACGSAFGKDLQQYYIESCNFWCCVGPLFIGIWAIGGQIAKKVNRSEWPTDSNNPPPYDPGMGGTM